ncbi:hypothetical protein ACFX12_005140 [Malus domestica]
MAMISNSVPPEEEFKQWVREAERSGGQLLSKENVLEKEAIKKKELICLLSRNREADDTGEKVCFVKAIKHCT